MARARVTIIGLGLVGTSMGLAIRRGKPELEVVGHDLNPDASKRAQKLGAIEKSEWNLINAVSSADLLILAVPAMAIKEVIELTKDDMKEGLVITDTAGSKGEVLQWARDLLPPHVSFVGGDPMVGSRDSQAAPQADLFAGVTYCISPLPTTPNEALQVVIGLLNLIGARVYFVDPHEHDGYVGLADHLSFMLSTALLRMTSSSASKPGSPQGDVRLSADVHRMIGPTFLRSASFSSIDPKTYRDLCLTNRDNIVRWLAAFREHLDGLSEIVESNDPKALEKLFDDALTLRASAEQPYRDADLEAEAHTIRTTSGFGLNELLGFRRRTPPERGKPNSGKRSP